MYSHKNLMRALFLASAFSIPATAAMAQEVAYTPAPVSGVTAHPFFPLSQINDGITDDLPPNYNGFITRTSSPVIEFQLGGNYDLYGMSLWNDVNVREEGVKDFTLTFYDDSNTVIGTYTGDAPIVSELDAEDYIFDVVNVNRIEMAMTAKDSFGVEIRELKLFGRPAEVPTSTDFACYDLMDHEQAAYRKVIRFEDQFGRSPEAVVGQPVSICNPSNVQTRTIDLDLAQDHLVCYEILDIRTDRTNEHRVEVLNTLEGNIVVTGQLDRLCMVSSKTHL